MFITRFIAVTAVTALLGVVLAGQAAAVQRPDDRSGVRGTGLSSQAAFPDFVDRYLTAQAARDAAIRPDNRGGARGEFRATVIHGTASTPGVDFQWDDAGIGAGLLAGMLLGGGGLVVLVRRNTRKSAALGGV